MMWHRSRGNTGQKATYSTSAYGGGAAASGSLQPTTREGWVVKKLMTMRDALTSRDYFAPLMGGESWRSWRVPLIAIMGEPLTETERETFHSLTERDNEPVERVDEFYAAIGRRGGKSRVISVLASYYIDEPEKPDFENLFTLKMIDNAIGALRTEASLA